MNNLLEALRQQQPQMQDTTSGLATLLRAKSGKAAEAPTTALSTQQEQAALAQTAQAMQPVQQAAQTQQAAQEQQQREVQQRAGQQQVEIAQAREANKMQTQLRTDQLLQELEQGRGRIDLAKYQSNLEQVGFNLRLNNKEYVDNLQREGDRARLTNKLQFDEQLAKSILGDNKLLLEKQLGNRSILAANDRQFSIKMAEMGIQNAWQLINNEIKGMQELGQVQAIGGLITTGIGAYGKYAEKSSPTTVDRSLNTEANESLFKSKTPFGSQETDVILTGPAGVRS